MIPVPSLGKSGFLPIYALRNGLLIEPGGILNENAAPQAGGAFVRRAAMLSGSSPRDSEQPRQAQPLLMGKATHGSEESLLVLG